ISKDYDIDQVCTISSSHSKFFAAFSDVRQTTISQINGLEEDFCFWTTNQHVYRIEMLEADEMTYKKNFQENIVYELCNCTTALNELFTPHFMEDLDKLQTITIQNEIERFCFLLLNAFQTVQVLRKRLYSLFCSNFPTILLFPDMFIPYLFALNCLVISLSEQHKRAKERLTTICCIQNNKIINFLQWLFKHWELWHEKYAKAKKEQLYVVRKKVNNEDLLDDDGQIINSNDVDKEELNNYLPDFSLFTENEPTTKTPISEETDLSLDGDDIYSALQTILLSSENLKLPFLNFMSFLADPNQGLFYRNLSSTTNEDFAFYHLLQLNELYQKLGKQPNEGRRQIISKCLPLNVYKESEPSSLIQCCELLEPLRMSASRLLNEFPENIHLLQLLSTIDMFNNAQAGVPLMKHAAQLERILEYAETWESISDRAHSMREQMYPLQELLVEWRRREVQCWNELISFVKRDTSQLTVMVSWPLFKYAFELECDKSKLLLMLTEWLQNSTLGDFETRIWTGRLLSHFISLFEQENEKISEEKYKLSRCVSCVVDHFERFKDQAKERYAQLYSPIETELRNFTRVVSYNDLNLWSVRESVKRAHVQLSRILRKFKLHGRALFERQQHFSLLIRSLNRLGLGSRRAHKIDSEKLTVETLTQVTPDVRNLLLAGDTINLLFRHTIASRNVFMRKFASWRRCSQDAPHLAEQLSPSILDNLRGTTEFGLYWILRALNGLATNGALEVKRLHLVSKCFETELENLRRPKDNLSTLTHKQITEKYAQNCDYIKNIFQIVDRIRKLLSCCPKEHYNQTSHDLGNLQEPLGILRQSDLQFSQLNKNVDDLLGIITKLCKLNENEKEFILHLPAIFEEKSNILEEDIWNKTRLSTYSQNFSLLLGDLKSIVMANNIKHYFPEDSRRICEIIDKISSFNECENVITQSTQNQSHFNENSFDELQHLLLFRLQNIFNQMESLLNSDSMNRFDAIKSLIEYFGQNAFKASNQLIKNFHIIFISSSIQSDTSIDLLNKFSSLAIGVHKLYERLLHYLCEFIFNSISLHEHWVAIGCHLLTNGFVNPIPKSVPSLQGDDKRVENMCGFGDGDLTNDAKDVGGELEAMEQIEGLKNGTENNLNDNQDVDQSNENPSDEQQKLPEVDNPIDVDDDFAGCIEGLDAQDGEEEENGDDNNCCEEDPNADWNFGEVDEPEERQLDPKLWEQNENDENEQEMEEDDNVGNGADSLTEDLVAAQQQKQQRSNENQEKGARSSDTYQSEEENVDDYDATEPDEKGERGNENENNASDGEQSTDKDIEDHELTQENDYTEQKDDNEERTGEEYLSEDEDSQKQNEKQEDKNEEGNSGEMEKEKDEDSHDEYQNNEAFNNEFEQDAIGDAEGTPNAARPPEIIDKEQEEKNDARTQGEDKSSNDTDADGEQNQRDSASRNPTKSVQLEKDSQQNEELNEVEPSKDNCNSGNERGGDNSVDEEMEENAFDEVEQEKLSVTGTSTLEQANRTRALFDISLRRLRKEVKTNELAENASDQQNLNKEKQNDEAEGEIEMDNEDNASIEIIDDSSAKEMLERETPTTSNEEDIRQLQLKWALISESVSSLASELAESLRSIIEPTVASKL
uniref:Midasin n=1 Tax=Meloidogyne javanica TaxID=6303 RepID=A0A915LZ24_MELJA